jgi:uncharacterized protein involved in type VI secretion and phage assembly
MPFYSSQPRVLVEAMPLSPSVAARLARANVDMSVFLPDQIELVFGDEDQQVLLRAGLAVGASITVAAVGDDGSEVPLSSGEVVALELDFDGSRVNTVVRALDRSHRMMRGRRTRSFTDMTVSEIVGEVVAEHGLVPATLWPETPFYERIVQPGVSDWQFVQYLAQLCGCLAYCSKGLFRFEPPPPAEEGPLAGGLLPNDPRQLVLGKNLRRLRAVVRAAEQVTGVEVHGFDPMLGTPVVGVGAPATTASEVGPQPEMLAALVGAGTYGGPSTYGGAQAKPVLNEEEAQMRAEAVASAIASSYAEIEGECDGNPHLVAGTAVGLRSVGEPFLGNYTLTSARHAWDRHVGYVTSFGASGLQDRTMLGLAGGGINPQPPPAPGVASGIVVNVDDPEQLGRVQLMLPWLSDTYVTDWVRVAQPHTGEGSGCLLLPDVDTEVLVAFAHGDLNHPVVVGSLYNGVREPAAPGYVETGTVAQRRLMSSERNALVLYDGEAMSGVEVSTGDQLQRVVLNMNEGTITVSSEGTITVTGSAIEINAQGDLSISAEGQIGITAGGGFSVDAGGDLSLASAGALSVEAGAEGSITAGANLSLDAPVVELS